MTTCNCDIGRLLLCNDVDILITGAQKQTDTLTGKSYMAYTIRLGNVETRHRYSEFESLRKALVRLYPTVIVPPIPEKHSLADYAALQTRVKDDMPMVEKRKRMLQSFLVRVAKHPTLGRDHVFHQFLEDGVVWSDVLHSPPLSMLAKNPLQTIVSKEQQQQQADLQADRVILSSNLIPIPSPTYVLKSPDERFEESERFTFRIANYMSNNLDKSQRKVIRRLGELANDYAELGAVYNGFSLNESDQVANAIEKIGQAVDASYMETAQMVTSLEGEFAEPIQEHSQFAQIIKQVLRFRHMKHAQVEMIETCLENKKATLENLQNMEQEARRLEEAISRERTIGANAVDIDQLNDPSSHDMPTRRPPPTWSDPVRLLQALGYSLQNMIDVDPTATRRNQIGKTKDAMDVLQQALEITRKDLAGASLDLQAELDRFQHEKIKDLRNMLIAYAKVHIQYCKQNLGSWQEARAEIDKIPSSS
ncbi:hypothetical protein O0I10_004830 [Lichtheimia ornata]|uniref:PX domain-containing protein n=1 Tax=Lichtheimia ornata TaxID=688661 RepID=A0AAD7XYU6_9FUNG|nr:uncharacterized protein O0I10_004830 [Lichtheimia ornata]KAJ8659465.1 hypothetical protein O0I10_004830 [Lichtheimia ornata]